MKMSVENNITHAFQIFLFFQQIFFAKLKLGVQQFGQKSRLIDFLILYYCKTVYNKNDFSEVFE